MGIRQTIGCHGKYIKRVCVLGWLLMSIYLSTSSGTESICIVCSYNHKTYKECAKEQLRNHLFLCKKNSSFRFVITQERIGAKVVCGAGMNNRLRPYDRYEMYEKYTFIYI